MADKKSATREDLILSDESVVIIPAELESFRHFEEEELLVDGFLHLIHGRDGQGYEVPCPPKHGFSISSHCLLLTPLSFLWITTLSLSSLHYLSELLANFINIHFERHRDKTVRGEGMSGV